MKYVIYIFLTIILISSNCQAISENNTKKIKPDISKLYILNVDNSLDVTNQYLFRNNNKETVTITQNLTNIIRLFSPSDEKTYNHSVFMLPNYEFILSEPPLDSGEFYFNQRFEEIPGPQAFIHYVEFNSNLPNPYVLKESVKMLEFHLKINNASIKSGDNYIITISPKTMISLEPPTELEYNDFNLRVDLPSSPYLWVDYVDSNIPPSNIISKGTGQSLVWDYCPNQDIILKYKIIENPIPKKIDELIEENNKILKQAQESSDLALYLGWWSVILGGFSIILGLLSVKKHISGYIEKFKK